MKSILKVFLKESVKATLFGDVFMKPYYRLVEQLYAMPANKLEEYKNEQFLKIFRTAIRQSPFYRRYYAEAGVCENDIHSLDDLHRLPIICKDDIRIHADEILTVPKRKVIEYHTSGTTGSPTRLYLPLHTLRMERAYTALSRRECGFELNERLLSMRGRLDRGQTHMHLPLSRTLYLSIYNLNDYTLNDYCRRIENFKPRAIESFPSTLYTLAIALRKHRRELDIPLAFTSSEMFLPHQAELIERYLHTRIYDHFGMTERSIHLTQNRDRSAYVEAPGMSANEFRNDCIISTSLINEAFPLIRYRQDDVANVQDGIIRNIDGRVEDFLQCKDGQHIMRLDFAFKEVKNVLMSQIVQLPDGHVNVNIVPDKGFSDNDSLKIKQNLIDLVGDGNMDFEVRKVRREDMIYTPGGKFKFLVKL